MSKTITSTQAQPTTREFLEWVRAEKDPVIVERAGKPEVVILRFDEYQRYLEYKAQLRERAERFRRLREMAEQNAAFNALSEAEGLALAEEIRAEVWRDNPRSS